MPDSEYRQGTFHQGKLTISHPQGGRMSWQEDGYVKIALSDSVSGLEFVSVEMTVEEFGRLLSRATPVEVEYETPHLDRVHKIKQLKVEWIAFDQLTQTKDEVLKPYEVDGWTAYKPDLGNHHRFRNGKYEVSFTRFVEPTITDVHTEHCCLRCGCKYGDDEECTVMRRKAPQRYRCARGQEW